MSTSSPATTFDRREVVQEKLLGAVDVLLASVIFVAPLFMGGRHPVGELAYVAMVSTTASLWCFRQAVSRSGVWRLSGVEALLICAVSVLVLQLIHWPLDWLATIAPLRSDLLPLWGDGPVRLGEWSTISFTPAATRGQLVVLIAHVMLFIVVVQRVQSAEDVQRLLRWMAVAAIGMATLALLQLFAGNGKFLWVYQDTSRTTEQTAKGAFANQNHLASFLALCMGPLIAWIAGFGTATKTPRSKHHRREQRNGSWNQKTTANDTDPHLQTMTLFVGLGIVAFAGLLTLSRGGVLVLAIAGALSTALLVWSGVLGRRAMGGLVTAIIFVAGALFIFGYSPLVREMETLSSGSIEEIDHNAIRARLWDADLNAASRSPWLGTGAASHAEVYPTFFPDPPEKEFTHAESGYIQLFLETGAVGLSIGIALLVTSLVWAWLAFRRGRQGASGVCAAVVFAGLVASAVHSIADFVWFIPACMSLTIVLAACACRLWQLSRPASVSAARISLFGEYPISGFSWSIVSIAIVGLGVLLIANRTGPALASSGWEHFLALRRSEVELGEETDSALLIQPLTEALTHQDDHPRAHLRLAAVCLRHFEQQQLQSDIPMPLSQIREAIKVSGFKNKKEQDAWIDRITGKNRQWLDRALFHTQRALAICPLQGEAYTMLAELAFLHGPRSVDEKLLIQQAIDVRPYDAHVLFAAGREAALAGDDKQMIQHWRRAFHGESKYRRQIIATLAPRVPVEDFLQEFNPTPPQMRELLGYYRDAQMQESATTVAQLLAADVEQQAAQATGSTAGELWNEAHLYYRQLGDEEHACACISNAVATDSLKYEYHRSLARSLLCVGRFDEAIDEIRWCRQRRTADASVEKLWAIARRGPRMEDASLR